MKHTLILFSGQNDSLIALINFLNENENTFVDLLYIKNVGVRNCNSIPFDVTSELFKTTQRIKNLYVIDGLNYQEQLIQDYAIKRVTQPVLIYDFCMICQFTIHSLYVYAANKLDCDIILPKHDMFPPNIMKIITSPYENCKKDIKKYDYPDIHIQTNIKSTKSVRRCQMAYFHNYKFNYIPVREDLKWFKECKVFYKCNENIKRIEFSKS